MDALILPTRYEVLRKKADEVQADVTRVIDRVPSAIDHIKSLFGQMRQTHVSRFEVLYAASGTGKTTFLESLGMYFEEVDVIQVPPPSQCDLLQAVDFIRDAASRSEKKNIIVYFGGTGRDNPSETDEEFCRFFEHLRGLFRETDCLVLVIWPLSQAGPAEKLYRLAHEVGADSLLGSSSSYFKFSGPERGRFYHIADETCRLLNAGHSLAEFGVDEETGNGLFAQGSTIAEYFQQMISISNGFDSRLGSLLEEKPRPRIWVLLPGDDLPQVENTVSHLTAGSRRMLDIPALVTELAPARAEAAYMNEWRALGSLGPFLLKKLDVRVVEVPPNLVLSIVRAYGALALRDLLKQKTGSKQTAVQQLRNSMLGELLLGLDPKPRRTATRTADTTADEYIRVQAAAKQNDQPLNASFADAIVDLFNAEEQKEGVTAPEYNVTIGKRVKIYKSLRPDIHLNHDDGEPICLEFTWRTTGRQVAGTFAGKQNTLNAGHIRPYVLSKVYEYIKALELDKLETAQSD